MHKLTVGPAQFEVRTDRGWAFLVLDPQTPPCLPPTKETHSEEEPWDDTSSNEDEKRPAGANRPVGPFVSRNQ